LQGLLLAICFQIDCKSNHFAHHPCIILNIFFTPIGIFPYACALFGRPFPVSPMVCLALPHTPLPRKQMSPAPYVTALKTAGYGRTGVERAQLPNIISFASNKTRELRAKNLRLFDKTRGLSKSGGGLTHKMVDYQNEYGLVKI